MPTKKPRLLHNLKCQECGKPATINIQEWYHRYMITPTGNFKETDDWDGGDNEFYCEKCAP